MNTKEELVKDLIADGYLKSSAFIEAFEKVDRGDFVPEEYKSRAYLNTALPLGHKQTVSQPLAVAFMLELLDLRAGEKILEIGTGSGWKTVLIGKLVGETGKVYSIERIEEIYNFAKQNITRYGFLEKGTVELILGGGFRGYGEQAPYDGIIASASVQEIPLIWKEQLKIGGKIVAPVKDSIIVIDKVAKDRFEQRQYFGFKFMPLVK